MLIQANTIFGTRMALSGKVPKERSMVNWQRVSPLSRSVISLHGLEIQSLTVATVSGNIAVEMNSSEDDEDLEAASGRSDGYQPLAPDAVSLSSPFLSISRSPQIWELALLTAPLLVFPSGRRIPKTPGWQHIRLPHFISIPNDDPCLPPSYHPTSNAITSFGFKRSHSGHVQGIRQSVSRTGGGYVLGYWEEIWSERWAVEGG